MFKMLKLDWSAMKGFHMYILLPLIALLVTGGYSSIYLVPLGVFLLFSFSVNTFAAEEKGDLNRLYLTLPIKRSQVVAGRYLMAFILYLAGVLTGLALMPLANLYSMSRWYPDLKWILAIVSSSFLLFALMTLAMYPILFKLGYQKGKLWGYYIPAFLVCLVYGAVMGYETVTGGTFLHELLLYASEHVLIVSGGIFGLGAAVLAVSVLLSMGIYSRREF